MIQRGVFTKAAELIEERGLCKTALHGHYMKAKGISVSGAIQSACLYFDVPTVGIHPHLAAFRDYCGVERVTDVEAGKATAEEIVTKLRSCAAIPR